MNCCYSYSWKSVKIRIFKDKNGLVLLLWEFCAMLTILHLYHSIHRSASSVNFVVFIIAVAAGILYLVLSGLLGDIFLGRYKIIKYSLWILWISTILNSFTEVIVQAENIAEWKWISSILLLCGSFGGGCFMVNGLHFGIDQLMDAPSWQISSYISWYCWCYYFSNVVISFLDCLIYPWSLVHSGVISFALTVAVVIDILHNHKLVKPSLSSNPLALIFKVLRYALRNKYPQAWSAYSYWDEQKCRIDLSKSKYGGPFRSEEVEEVKTFLKMLGILSIGSFFVGYFIVYMDTAGQLLHHFQGWIVVESECNLEYYKHCLLEYTLCSGSSLIVTIGVPFIEFVVYPLFQKCSFPITAAKKFQVGMLFLLASQLSYLGLNIGGYREVSVSNDSQSCWLGYLKYEMSSVYNISFYWLYMPLPFSGLSYYLLFTSTTEFLCSQSPYSMKGLLMGLTYSLVAFFIAANYGLLWLYQTFYWHSLCGVVYYTVSVVVTVTLVFVFFIASKWYSRRQWRDNLFEDSYRSHSHPFGTTLLGTSR